MTDPPRDAPADDPLLSVRGLTAETGDAPTLRLLDGVDLDVGRGEVLALVGESGCGKTMTSLSVLGLQPATVRIVGGRVRFDGQDLVGRPEQAMERLRGRRIAMIFQDPMSALNPVHRVGDTLVRSLVRHRGLERTAATAEAKRLLDRVRLPRAEACLRAFPHELSGGMSQRVMIAIALSGGPDLLIADEPTTALDVTVQRQVLDLLRDVQAETGMAMVLISHDLGVVAQVAHRVAVLYCGRVVETAHTGDLFASPRHPYSAGLIASVPPDPRTPVLRPARPIRGTVAPAAALPTGCHFHPRCDRALEVCAEAVPPSGDVGAGCIVACHRPLEPAEVA